MYSPRQQWDWHCKYMKERHYREAPLFSKGESSGISARLAFYTRACFSAACLILCFAVAMPSIAEVPAKISPRDLQSLIANNSVMLINVMSILECRDHQIPGSICIPCEDLGKQAPRFLENKPERIVIYGDRADDAANCQAVQQVLAAQNVSILDGGLEAWKKAGYQSVSLEHIPRLPVPGIRPQALKALTGTEKQVLILDIRPEDLFRQSHIEGAVNIPLCQLQARYSELPYDRRIIVVDADGSRALFAASYLERKGYREVGRLSGGMKKWYFEFPGEKK